MSWTSDLPPIQAGDLWRTRDWLRGEPYIVIIQSLVGQPPHSHNNFTSVTSEEPNKANVSIKAINPPKTIANYTRRMSPMEFWRFYEPLNSET